jgi:hypothetical protein
MYTMKETLTLRILVYMYPESMSIFSDEGQIYL